eukprot:m.123247 g.123247  ORF g.123247 m.123247 type:complete len:311 (+) comp28974_c0_seq2:74-1006(+)
MATISPGIVPGQWPELLWVAAHIETKNAPPFGVAEYKDLVLVNKRSTSLMENWTCLDLMAAMGVARDETFGTDPNVPTLERIAQPQQFALPSAAYNTTIASTSWTPAGVLIPTVTNSLEQNRRVTAYSESGIVGNLFSNKQSSESNKTEKLTPPNPADRVKSRRTMMGKKISDTNVVLGTTIIRIVVQTADDETVADRMIQLTMMATDTLDKLKVAVTSAYQLLFDASAMEIEYFKFNNMGLDDFNKRIYEQYPTISTPPVVPDYVTIGDCFPQVNGTGYFGGICLTPGITQGPQNYFRNQIIAIRKKTL